MRSAQHLDGRMASRVTWVGDRVRARIRAEVRVMVRVRVLVGRVCGFESHLLPQAKQERSFAHWCTAMLNELHPWS